MGPDKTLKVSDKANVSVDGNSLQIEATKGLISVVVADTDGVVMWVYHPLSGWYIERDMRKEGGE